MPGAEVVPLEDNKTEDRKKDEDEEEEDEDSDWEKVVHSSDEEEEEQLEESVSRHPIGYSILLNTSLLATQFS